MGKKTVAQWVADQLAAWGVQSVYGLVGDAIIPLVDAINQHPQLRYYNVKHEGSAAFMASAEAKLTGRLGVCIATSGPGIANLINGLADAKNDQTPVLAITGQVDGFNIGTDYKQYVNQAQLMAAVTEFSGLAVTPESCNDNLVKAMRIALSTGTVTQVSFTRDIWLQTTDEPIRAPEPYLKTRAQSDPEVITEAIGRLNTAQRPAIIVGRGIRGNASQLFELAEKWGSGICYTMAAKGALPGTHPLVMGGLGEGGSGATNKMIAEADLIFIIGANWWPDQFIPGATRIVQLDAIPINIGARLPVEYGIVGDPASILPLITEGIHSGGNPNWKNRLKELRNDWLEQIYPEATAEGAPIHPARLMKSLERVIAPNAILALDVGDHTLWFDRIFAGAEQDILISGTWRTLGFGLPAAISAKLAQPERQVVAVVGDGGITQVLAEFLTAVRYQAPITVIVVNNGYLAMEKGRMEEKGMPAEVTKLTNPDFAKYAEICGGKGFRVEHSDELETVLKNALQSQTPNIVEVITGSPRFPGVK